MKRAALGILLALAAGAPAMAQAGPAVAQAGCTDEIRAIKLKLPAIKEPARREELQKLVDKADKDDKAGRAKLCDETVKHADVLLK
jgi:hypothetical protein